MEFYSPWAQYRDSDARRDSIRCTPQIPLHVHASALDPTPSDSTVFITYVCFFCDVHAFIHARALTLLSLHSSIASFSHKQLSQLRSAVGSLLPLYRGGRVRLPVVRHWWILTCGASPEDIHGPTVYTSLVNIMHLICGHEVIDT